jgi:hypothetical protein
VYGDDPELDAGEYDVEDDSIDPGHVQGVDYDSPPKEVRMRCFFFHVLRWRMY